MESIKEKQKAALKQMLNLNESIRNTEPVWKILIYDRIGKDIITPLLTVKELRDLGVTLHMQLHSDRDSIPDVPAIYFVLPNEENIGRIGQDFHNNLYDYYHLNFITPISRQRLEDLAEFSLQANCVTQIQKVYDQYLNFISLEDDLFILRQQNADAISYYGMNKGDVKDYEMDATMDLLVEGLFSIFATLASVPIIRCPRGSSAAQMLAEKLDKKLRDSVRDKKNNLFITPNTSFRPLLVILDRHIDMATPLHHTWTYQALTHDVLDLSLNKVVVEEPLENSAVGGTRAKAKTCQLDSSDTFWTVHKGSPFPTVAEAIQEELEQYRNSEEEVKRLKKSMGLDGDSDAVFAMVSDNTAKLTSAVNSLPQLLEKKRLIDMHMTLATGILNAIKSRRLDTLFEAEEKIMGRIVLDCPVADLLTDPEVGNAEDKLRLFLIYYLCQPSVSETELKKCCGILEAAGCNLAPFLYLKRWKAHSKLEITNSSLYQGSGTKTVSMFSKLVSQGSSFVMEGVKNLVVKKHNLPVTRIVDELMEQKNSHETEDYLYFDPKKVERDGVKAKGPFQEAVVFMVGGGNYIEYQNLIDYVKRKPGGEKRIVYGASSMSNAKDFLRQLTHLGEEL